MLRKSFVASAFVAIAAASPFPQKTKIGTAVIWHPDPRLPSKRGTTTEAVKAWGWPLPDAYVHVHFADPDDAEWDGNINIRELEVDPKAPDLEPKSPDSKVHNLQIG